MSHWRHPDRGCGYFMDAEDYRDHLPCNLCEPESAEYPMVMRDYSDFNARPIDPPFPVKDTAAIGTTEIMAVTPQIQAVITERARQAVLKNAGKFAFTCADTGITDSEKLAVLAEEFGEVSREVCEAVIEERRAYPGEDPELVLSCMLRTRNRLKKKLREELIQVAAVAVAWCEALDKEIE